MSIELEIIYKNTATDNNSNPHEPRLVYYLPLCCDYFVADCSDLPEFEE